MSFTNNLLDWLGRGYSYSGNRQSDAHGSYGYGYDDSYECDKGISIAVIATTVLGIGSLGYILYSKITMGRRKRRSVGEELTGMVQSWSDQLETWLEVVTFGNWNKKIVVGYILSGHE